MNAGPKLFRVNPEDKKSEQIDEVEFRDLGLKERQDIQEWIVANPEILDNDLLIIDKEFSGFDRTNERLDLLAVDVEGRLVIIELKRDDSGSDAHWQAIKYASYMSRASVSQIVDMLAAYGGTSEIDAQSKLRDHIDSDDLDIVNNDQRIILASHRFAPEVTSAALWLNDKAPSEDLITCIQLTPYRDSENQTLYVQANTIIPVPGIDDYVVGIGDSRDGTLAITKGRNAQRKANENDEVTAFCRKVAELVRDRVSQDLRPDKESRHASGWGGDARDYRYYRLFYSDEPWHNSHMYYHVNLMRQKDDLETIGWPAEIGFRYRKGGKNSPFKQTEVDDLELRLEGVQIFQDQQKINNRMSGIFVKRSSDNLNDDFARVVANTLIRFIEDITPEIGEFESDRNTIDAQ